MVTKGELRVLFIFDPQRNAVLLRGGDKSGDYAGWYQEHLPLAETIYEAYLAAPDWTPYQEE